MGDSEHLIEMMGDCLEQQEENRNLMTQRQSNSFSSKVMDELMEIQRRGDIPFYHIEKMRNLMHMMSNSSSRDLQFCGNDKMRALMEKQLNSSVDCMPFCDNMVHIMCHELYEVVCDNNANANRFVHTLEQVCEKNKVDLATIFFNQVTPTGDSLLHVAAQHGSEQIVLLIAFHYPKLLYKKNMKGDTPLHVAARAKNVLAIKNILDMDKHFMISSGEAAFVGKLKFLMLHNIYGRTALHEAVLSHDYSVVLLLLVAHEQSDLSTYWSWNSSYVYCKSPMYLAALTRVEDILDLLLRLIPIPSGKAISNGDSPIHAAISERNNVLLEMIVDRRQELLYQRDENNNTPLHYAAYASYTEGVRIMLEKSPMIAFQRNSDGNLPIHIACQKRNVKVVKELLKIEWPNAGLFLNNKGQNIVHIAAMKGGSNMTRYLLKHPKIHHDTVNERDVNGDTPLHLASRELRLWTLLLLSRHKMIDVNIVNNEGFTARDVVWMQCRIPMTRQEVLGLIILKRAGTPRKEIKLGTQSKISINKEWNVKEAGNTLLIVAILIATVSFAAGFTVPGGFNNSDSSIAKEGGMALLSDHTLFKIFMAFNTVAMYSSTFASSILLVVPIGDPRLAERAFLHAVIVVQVALTAMSVAFLAAIRLIASNNTSLAHVINVIGFISIFFIVFFHIIGWFPIGTRLPVYRQITDLIVWIIVLISYGPNDVQISDFVGSRSN